MSSRPTVILDLDGVLYRGRDPLPGARDALRRLEEGGLDLVFVTNNSTRTDEQAAAKLESVVGYHAEPSRIITSAKAAVSLLPGSGRCMIVGGDGVRRAVEDAGLETTSDWASADCVVVGLDRAFDYAILDNASAAIRAGAAFIATNRDPTFPASSGLKPGAGSIVAAIEAASGVSPIVAGKPEKPMKDLIKRRGIERAWVVGDRLDTDIALAADEPAWTSILVLSGVTSERDRTELADHVVADVGEAADLVLAQHHER